MLYNVKFNGDDFHHILKVNPLILENDSNKRWINLFNIVLITII